MGKNLEYGKLKLYPKLNHEDQQLKAFMEEWQLKASSRKEHSRT